MATIGKCDTTECVYNHESGCTKDFINVNDMYECDDCMFDDENVEEVEDETEGGENVTESFTNPEIIENETPKPDDN